jgi:hypothetical protein
MERRCKKCGLSEKEVSFIAGMFPMGLPERFKCRDGGEHEWE